jgi:hypothetical protein
MMMVDKATNDAQWWNDLLAITGGALEIPKSKFHLASYKFAASGAPVLDPLTDAINGSCPIINIQPVFGESESQSLEYLQPSTLDAHWHVINARQEIPKRASRPSGKMPLKRFRLS